MRVNNLIYMKATTNTNKIPAVELAVLDKVNSEKKVDRIL